MLMYVLGIMGSGKTLFTTAYAKDFSDNNKTGTIFANYHLKLPRFQFSPFMFLPFSELKNSLIICDDFYAMDNLKAFTGIIANMSRKMNITIILTAQYYTMIPPKIRTIADFKIHCKYDKLLDTLDIMFIDGNNNVEFKQVNNAVQNLKELYDTSEIVIFPLESEILIEIAKVSKTTRDIEYNLMLYTKSSVKREKLLKKLTGS